MEDRIRWFTEPQKAGVDNILSLLTSEERILLTKRMTTIFVELSIQSQDQPVIARKLSEIATQCMSHYNDLTKSTEK